MGHFSGTPSSVITTDAPSHGRSQGWSSWMWPDSALFDAALSTLIGVVYGHFILGPALNPTNLAWLTGDPAQYYIGWALFAQTPGWHWPLTFTDRIGYPIGDAIANVDPNPLAALLLRPFAFLLPAEFQYLGPWAVQHCASVLFRRAASPYILRAPPVAVIMRRPAVDDFAASGLSFGRSLRAGEPLAYSGRVLPVLYVAAWRHQIRAQARDCLV